MIGRRIFAIVLGFLGLLSALILSMTLIYDVSLINFDYLMMITLLIVSFIGLLIYSIQKEENKTILNVGIYGVYYTIVMVTGFLSSILSIFVFAASETIAKTNAFNIIYFFVDLFTLLFIILIVGIFYFEEISEHFKKFLKKIPSYITFILFYYLCMILLNFFFSIFANVWSELAGLNNEVVANQDLIDSILEVGFWVNLFFIINIVIVAPIVEEFFFRYILIDGVLMRVFKIEKGDMSLKIMKIIFIVIISSSLFAAAHALAASNILYFIKDMLVYLPASIVFSAVYVIHRNIFLNIGLHMFNNFLVTLIFYILV